jgi:hypothetical protein
MAGVPPAFVPGLDLARDFYHAVVAPLLGQEFPRLRYAAALLGPGSEVAGLDSERSTDHDWGPRLQILLTGDDVAGSGEATAGSREGTATLAGRLTTVLAERLPESFRGYPVRFPVTREADGVPRPRVEAAPLGGWLAGLLGFDPRAGATLLDWLATPWQRLAEFTGGEVFADGPGELTGSRRNLAWYPADLWCYVLASQWQRISQEEAFPGRCAEAGDEPGSRVVTARLARDLMRLCLLMHRRYPPYSKWLGTAFARLPGTADLATALGAALAADRYPDRERHLGAAYAAAARQHNALGLTPPLDPRTRGYYGRPYQVIGAARFADALRAAVGDPRLRRLPLTGTADQFTDSTDANGDLRFLRACSAARLASAGAS